MYPEAAQIYLSNVDALQLYPLLLQLKYIALIQAILDVLLPLRAKPKIYLMTISQTFPQRSEELKEPVAWLRMAVSKVLSLFLEPWETGNTKIKL